jgi:hypothetical protein
VGDWALPPPRCTLQFDLNLTVPTPPSTDALAPGASQQEGHGAETRMSGGTCLLGERKMPG